MRRDSCFLSVLISDRLFVQLHLQMQDFRLTLQIMFCVNAVCKKDLTAVFISAKDLISLHCNLCVLCCEEAACRHIFRQQKEGKF